MRALSEVLGERLEYDTIGEMRDRMWDVCPTLVRYDELETVSVGAAKSGLASMKAIGRKVEGGNVGEFKKPFRNFYQTDSISRNSATMAKCTVSPSVLFTSLGTIADPVVLSQRAFTEEFYPEGAREQSMPVATHA